MYFFLNWIGGVGWMPIWLFLLRCFHRFLFSIDKIHTSMGYSYACTGRFIRFSLSIIMKRLIAKFEAWNPLILAVNIVRFTTYCKKFVIIKANPLSLIQIRLDKTFIMHTLKAHMNLNFCSAFVLVSCNTKCAIIPEIVNSLCTCSKCKGLHQEYLGTLR